VKGKAAPWAGFIPAGAVAVALAFELLRHGARLDHDAAMYMACAARLLAGARPYLDLVEVNPPLAWVVYGIPELAARALAPLGVPVAVAFHAVIVSWTAIGLALVWGLIDRERRRAFVAAWLFCQLLAVVVPFRLHWVDYWVSVALAQWGQREHLFWVAGVVWLAVRAARAGGVPMGTGRAVSSGVLAGLMASLKPHFVVLLVTTEIVASVARPAERTRAWNLRSWLAPEIVAFAIVPVLYAAQFLLWPAEWRVAAFSRWLPWIAANYDNAYGVPFAQVAFHALPSAAVLALAWLARAASTRAFGITPAANALVFRLLVFATGALGLALFQHKGFVYHFFPVQAAAVLAAGLLFPTPASASRTIRSALAALAVSLAAFCLLLPVERLAPRFTDALEAALDETKVQSGDRVLVLGDAVLGPWPALRERGLVQSSRFPWFFPLPLVLNMPPGPARDAEAARLAQELATDGERERPRAVFIQAERMQALPDGFDQRAWLEHFAPTRRAFHEFRSWRRVGPWWVAVSPAH
jgi:hypothetical protein